MSQLSKAMIHPALRMRPLEELGVTRNIVAAIYCDLDMLWDIAHAFPARDAFSRELAQLACVLEERIREEQP